MSITASFTALRTSGTAPLGVLFDASATTSTDTTDPFKEILYYWDFGDTATAWTYGVQKFTKNNHIGPIAGHVYETPGTFTATLHTLYRTSGGIEVLGTVQTQTITVNDPDATTYPGTQTICVSTSGNTAGMPSGALLVTSSASFDSIISSRLATNRRVLFCRGETWTSNGANVGTTGPWTIGAYGSGAKPIIQGVNTSNTSHLAFTSSATDGRVMDLNLDGRSFNQPGNAAIGGSGGKRITILRCDAHHVNRGFAVTMGTGSGEWCVHDCTFVNGVANNSIAFYSPAAAGAITDIFNYFSAQGNSFDCRSDPTAAETVRLPFMRLSVLANNTLGGPSGSFDTIKLHNLSNSGPIWGGNWTELSLIADNWVIGSTSGSQLTAGPQNFVANEKMRNCIVDGNYWEASSSTQVPIILEVTDFRVSNNIAYMNNINAAYMIWIKQRDGGGIEPTEADIKMYNNSVYVGGSSSTNAFSVINSTRGTGHLAYNNIGYAPFRSAPTMFGSTTGITQSNNSNDSQVKSTNPWGTTPTSMADFAILTASYAKDSGTYVPLFHDYFKIYRPQTSIDKGASEFSVGTQFPWTTGGPTFKYWTVSANQ